MKVDLSGAIKVSLDKALAEANQLENNGHAQEAASAYVKVAKLMNCYPDYALTREDQLRRRGKARVYLEPAGALRSGLRKTRRATPAPQGSRHSREPDIGDDDRDARDVREFIYRSNVTWEEIGGLEDTKREIKFTYGLALAQKPDGVTLRRRVAGLASP